MGDPAWRSGDHLPRPAGVAADAIVRVLRVPSENSGMRLDTFLSVSLRSTSRTRAKLIANTCAYAPDGRRLRANDRLKAEDQIALWRPPVDEADDTLELPVVYEDEHLLVINKPANLTVHPTARHYHATVLRMLHATRPNESLSLVHRLDKDTSGVLLIARTPEADRAFKLLFEGRDPSGQPLGGRTVRKFYQAITWGVPPAGSVTLPLEPDPENALKVKMRVARAGQGLDARTDVVLLETAGAAFARLQCELYTGRQHQIRVHLAAQGHPVVGDKLYGPDERLLARAADGLLTEEDQLRLIHPRHALHAETYELDHAITGLPLRLHAPLPSDLMELWSRLRADAAG